MPPSRDRMNLDMSIIEAAQVLAEGVHGAILVLKEFVTTSSQPWVELYILDAKRLYGGRIWDLYLLCGKDIQRFRYHVSVELPNQETGELTTSGPYSASIVDKKGFWKKRQFGGPGKFWALQDPPKEVNYKYPIT